MKAFVLRTVLILVIISIFSIDTNAQRIKVPVPESTNRVVLNRKDTIYTFYTNKFRSKKMVTKPPLFYSWYDKDTVSLTQGAYGGRLLNGSYKVFYPNRNLKEQGQFLKGLRNGIWSYWQPNGIKRKEEVWNKGLLEGQVTTYNEKGGISKIDWYKNGILSYPRMIYTNDNKVIKTYKKKGVIVSDTTSLSL